MGEGGGGVDKLASHHTTSSEKFCDFSGAHPSPDIFSKLDPSLLIVFLQSLVNWSFSKTEKKKKHKNTEVYKAVISINHFFCICCR